MVAYILSQFVFGLANRPKFAEDGVDASRRIDGCLGHGESIPGQGFGFVGKDLELFGDIAGAIERGGRLARVESFANAEAVERLVDDFERTPIGGLGCDVQSVGEEHLDHRLVGSEGDSVTNGDVGWG